MSTSSAHASAPKKRPYRLGRRADTQRQTRQRIVAAAVELHGSIGPAHTTVAQIARRAGVQRHTFYAHFPDERSLLTACSALSLERDPLPDPEQWLAKAPGRGRLKAGLADLYGWFERNSKLVSCVLRDSEHHQPTRDTIERRWMPLLTRMGEVLSEGLDERSVLLLDVAMDFACWRRLSARCGSGDAAELMSDAIASVIPGHR
jgi:AcrR family transcriptional regulator